MKKKVHKSQSVRHLLALVKKSTYHTIKRGAALRQNFQAWINSPWNLQLHVIVYRIQEGQGRRLFQHPGIKINMPPSL